MVLTDAEQNYLLRLRVGLEKLRAALNDRSLPVSVELVEEWFAYLSHIRDMMGNASNGVSFAATLMAKAYLQRKLPLRDFDVAAKAMGAPGLDIEAVTEDGERVIGEIKTTVPYGPMIWGPRSEPAFRRTSRN